MTIVLFIVWFVLTFGSMAVILHEIGGAYGEHVAMDIGTRITVFAVCGTIVGLALGFLRWVMS